MPEVLFVGEGPGESEDVIGKPFVGPAGSLLDRLIEESGLSADKIGFANLLLCIPWNDDKDSIRPPKQSEIKACRPRLLDLLKETKPRVIVCVGQVSAKAIPEGAWELKHIIHPSAILRMDERKQIVPIKRTINTLKSLA